MSLRVLVLCASSSAATIVAIRVWDAYISPRLWKRRMRQLAIESGEPSVLDVSPSNVAAYRRGGVALIMKVRITSSSPFEVPSKHCSMSGTDLAYRART
eukprot:3006656-Rhodomonas_salina.1